MPSRDVGEIGHLSTWTVGASTASCTRRIMLKAEVFWIGVGVVAVAMAVVVVAAAAGVSAAAAAAAAVQVEVAAVVAPWYYSEVVRVSKSMEQPTVGYGNRVVGILR